jgi:hypothetical protein
MKTVAIIIFLIGLAGVLASFVLELWWRCHSDNFNLFSWQAGILLWIGTPGIALSILGGYLLSIAKWSD